MPRDNMQAKIHSSSNRLDGIQVLRAWAALIVVFTHSITRISVTFPGNQNSSFFRTASGGQWTVGDIGVDIFFVVSGFIMFYIHKNDFYKENAGWSFMKKRIIRIVPNYWVMTSLALIILILYPKWTGSPFKDVNIFWVVGSYLFIPVISDVGSVSPLIGVGWTLQYEFMFYIIFMLSLGMPRRIGLIFMSSILIVLVLFGSFINDENPLIRFITSWLLINFLGGVFVAYWIMFQDMKSLLFKKITIFLSALVVLLTVIWPPPETGFYRFLLWGVPSIVAVWVFHDYKVPDSYFGKSFKTLGDASYSIYLFQVFALPGWAYVLNKIPFRFFNFDLYVAVLTALVILSGVMCWFCIEKPLSNLTKTYVQKRTLAN